MSLKFLRDEVIYSGQFINVIKRHFINGEGKPGIWETVERKIHGRIVGIVAITSELEIILVKIFRMPLGGYAIEFPAGLMDKKGETEEDAIKRELLEETGYVVDKVELLFHGPFNAGLLKDEMAIYLGLNAKFIQNPQLENSEDITVIKVPLSGLIDFIIENQNKIKIDLKIASVVPFLERRNLMG